MQKQFIRRFLLNNRFIAYLIAATWLVVAALVAVSIGTISLPVGEIITIISAKLFGISTVENISNMHVNIVMNIRLPRVILAGLVGASLAIAGAAFQGLLRNPLADPYTLGVSSGASVGAVLVLFFNFSLPLIGRFTLPFVSIIFSIITIFFVLYFARKIDRTLKVETIILTGIIFSSFLGAFISLMIALKGQDMQQIVSWLLGSVSMRGWEYILLVLPFLLIGSVILVYNGRELNALSFGEEQALHIGVDVERRKLMILLAGSIVTGSAVAVSGTIGFVGLVIPHLTRILWGPDHRHLLPLSILTGATFLILADLVARTVISPTELPIGVITSLIGAPVFAIILLRRRKEGRG